MAVSLKVNEVFGPTRQGEGRSMGMPAMFLRLYRCNLACGWCDTPWTWNAKGTPFLHPEKHDRTKEEHEMSILGIIARLKKMGPDTKALVISGGEPMLQQPELTALLRILKKDNYWVEIETNGTIEPTDEFLKLIDQINCSPKTSNSGPDNTCEMRERPKALKKLAASEKTYFKFVVQNRDDLPEINDLVCRYNMRRVDIQKVYLMAEGNTRKEQFARMREVQEISRENEYEFTNRLHVLLWDRRRGV